MNRKKKSDRPALSFADSSVQGRSADAEANDEEEVIADDPPPPRRTRGTKLQSDWITAVRSSDDKGQGNESSDENFIALPQSRRSNRKRGTANQREDKDWQADEDDVYLLDNDDDDAVIEEEEDDDDDDFEPSTSKSVKKPKPNNRMQLQKKREQERKRLERERQEEEARLQHEEDLELQRALEISRIEMEEASRIKKQEEAFLAGIDFQEEETNNSSPGSGYADSPNRYITRTRDNDGDIGGSSVTEDSEPENIGNPGSTNRPVKHPSLQEMVRSKQSVYEWQETDNAEAEESTQVGWGNAGARNSQSPSMFSTPASAEGSHSQQSNKEMPSSTSGASSSSKTKEVKQETIDKAFVRATRLGLRKRPLEDNIQISAQPRKIARATVVPQPPELSTLDNLILDINEDEVNVVNDERKVENRVRSHAGGVKGQVKRDNDEEEYFTPLDQGDVDEGLPLVDTRNQADKPPMYAPKGVCFKNYTKVILKLLRHYCLRLRNTQATSALRVEWGSPVVPGPLFSGTLLYRKRGMKAPVPMYSLSDDDTPNHVSDDEWKVAVKPTVRPGIKDSQGTRKRKRRNVIADSDSDLEDFDIGSVAKKTQRTMKVKGQNVVNIDENVPLLKIECVATIGDRSKVIDNEDLKVIADEDLPRGSSRIDDNIGGSGGVSDVGVRSGINGGDEDDASQTLAYDAYNADTEEFVGLESQQNILSVNEADEASTSVQRQEISKDEEEKRPSTSSTAVVESTKDGMKKGPSTSTNSSASVAESGSNLKDMPCNQVEAQVSEEVENIEDGSENVTGQNVTVQEDPCLVDSTTISVLRKSRHVKRMGSSQNSQSSQNSHQGAVSSSEAQETGNDNKITEQNQPKAIANLSNSSKLTNSSKDSEVAGAVEESASTSESTSVALRTTSESNVETTSSSSKQQPQRRSPTDNVSSMPKSIPTGDSVQHVDPEAGVSSSKEATPQKKQRPSKEPFKDKYPNLSFEEVRLRFLSRTQTEATGATESSAAANKAVGKEHDEDLKKAVREACSDVLTGSKSEDSEEDVERGVQEAGSAEVIVESKSEDDEDDLEKGLQEVSAESKFADVSSSFSVRTKPKNVTEKRARVKLTMQKESTDVASTSDNPECEMAQPSRPNVSTAKIHERHRRHQSPGVASSSDDQRSSPRQRTVNSDQEAESSSSSSAVATAVPRAGRVPQGREAVESSGLDSDASGVVVRPRRPKAGSERASGIGSSDEATTSGENSRSDSKVENRNGEEASTSADFQPVNKEPTKGREAQAAPKQEESTVRGSRTSTVTAAVGRLPQPAGDDVVAAAAVAATPDEAVSSNESEVLDNVIKVECPLCSIQFPLEQIEAHASECEGPQEQEVAEMPPVQTRLGQQRQNADIQENQVEDKEEEEDADNAANHDARDDQSQHSEEYSFPNSSWNAEWLGRKDSSRKKPVHTYSRLPKTAAGASHSNDSEDDWLTAEEDNKRPSRIQRGTKRTRPVEVEDEDEEEGTNELDPVDAAIYQMAENNEIQLVEPRPARGARTGKTGRNAQTRSPPTEDDEDDDESLEKCFLCNKLIPKSLYATHVNAEVDRMQNNDDSAEGAASGEALQAGTGLVRRTRRTEASSKPDDQQNAADSSNAEIIDDSSEEEDDDNDDEQPFNPANVSFGDSPIRAYKKISEQPTNLIDFKNQFKTSTSTVSLFNGKGRGKGKSYGKGKAYRGKRGRGRGKRRR